MNESAVRVQNLAFSYTREPVLQNISFELLARQSMVIYGSNGCGKSTLLRLLLGELKAKEDSIYVFGQDVTGKTDWADVGYVPQGNVNKGISFPVTCEEILAASQYRQMGRLKIARKEHYRKAREVLERFGLSGYARVPFRELSGGLQQRVMIARAMQEKPSLLILDEPTAGVDEASKVDFLTVLNELKASGEIAYIMVTHEKNLAEDLLDLDQVYALRNGRLEHV